MLLEHITPLILTFNEAPNLERCLERLRWARRVVVLDSGSTDETAALAANFPTVEFLVRTFDEHSAQWNHGLDAVATDWVLALDADYVLGLGFEKELAALPMAPEVHAYAACFRYLIGGTPLRASLYPPRHVLFRRGRCSYVQDGHTQLLQVEGRAGILATKIDHDDRKPLGRWLISQDKYAVLEAAKLLAPKGGAVLRLQDRIRRLMVIAPWLTLIYTLLVRRTLLDGWPGIYYALQRTLAELVLSLRLMEARLLKSPK